MHLTSHFIHVTLTGTSGVWGFKLSDGRVSSFNCRLKRIFISNDNLTFRFQETGCLRSKCLIWQSKVTSDLRWFLFKELIESNSGLALDAGFKKVYKSFLQIPTCASEAFSSGWLCLAIRSDLPVCNIVCVMLAGLNSLYEWGWCCCS